VTSATVSSQAGDPVVELEHEPDVLAPEPRQRLVVGRGEVVVQIQQLPARGRVEAAEDVQQGRLAAARCAEQDDELAGGEIQIHLAQGVHFDLAHLVHLAHAAYAEYGLASHGLGPESFHREPLLTRSAPADLRCVNNAEDANLRGSSHSSNLAKTMARSRVPITLAILSAIALLLGAVASIWAPEADALFATGTRFTGLAP